MSCFVVVYLVPTALFRFVNVYCPRNGWKIPILLVLIVLIRPVLSINCVLFFVKVNYKLCLQSSKIVSLIRG